MQLDQHWSVGPLEDEIVLGILLGRALPPVPGTGGKAEAGKAQRIGGAIDPAGRQPEIDVLHGPEGRVGIDQACESRAFQHDGLDAFDVEGTERSGQGTLAEQGRHRGGPAGTGEPRLGIARQGGCEAPDLDLFGDPGQEAGAGMGSQQIPVRLPGQRCQVPGRSAEQGQEEGLFGSHA